MPMQITAHAIGIAMHFALSGAEWAELSCLSASFFFFFFAFWGGFFFEVGKKKKVSESPPPPPLWICCPFYFIFWRLCLFLDGLGAFLLSQSALPKSKVPFLKMALPFQILNSSPVSMTIKAITTLLLHVLIIYTSIHCTFCLFNIKPSNINYLTRR